MVSKKIDLPLVGQEDIVTVRQAVRTLAVESGLTLIDQTKLVTAASELARNTVIHGGGGHATLEIVVDESGRRGVRLTFEDQGAGIADIELAMKDGYTTGAGLGLGLGGAKRLCNEFSIQSKTGQGTRVTIGTWKGHGR